jgi:hypothetical protein
MMLPPSGVRLGRSGEIKSGSSMWVRIEMCVPASVMAWLNPVYDH